MPGIEFALGKVMEKTPPLSTREWLLVIVIIMGVQFILHTLSYLYSGSSNALGYVSFAGTIVSILLGLIAIIYSFVQSVSHGSSVRDVKEQAMRLVEAGRDIALTKNSLSDSAVRISDIADSLIDRINENTDATNKVAGVVNKISESFEGELGKVSDKFENSPMHSILDSNRMWVVMMVICVGEAIKRGWGATTVEEKIVGPLLKKLGMSEEGTFTIYFVVAMCLEAEGLVVLAEENSVETPPVASVVFSDRIELFTKENIDREDAEYKALKEIIQGLD